MARRATARLIHPSLLGLGVAAFFVLVWGAAAAAPAPSLAVYAPADGARLVDDRAIVFGATERGASVTVNGVAAEVNIFDGTFEVRDLSLAPTGVGCLQSALITVTAADAGGNKATVVRSVTANHCVTHPTLAYPIPDLVVGLGQSERASLDLSEYFTDDGGSALLMYSTYVVEGAASGVSVTYSPGGFGFAWSPAARAGTLSMTVTARDRNGEVSDPVKVGLVVLPAPSGNRAPEIILVRSPEALPVGGQVTFEVAVSDVDGDAVALSVEALSAGIRIAEGTDGAATVTVGASREALGAGPARVRVTATDGHLTATSLEVVLLVYDPALSPGFRLESGVPEVYVSQLQAPPGVSGVFADIVSERPVFQVSLHRPVSGTEYPNEVALNDEQTYWRMLVELPPTPGIYTQTLWVMDPGLPAEAHTIMWTVLADPLPPSILRIVPVGGSLAVAEGEPVALQFVGEVPDAALTTFEWMVDGEVVARTPRLDGVVLDPGAHTVTVTAVAPGGSSSASASVTVTPRAGPVLPARATPWFFWLGIAGLVAVGLVLGGTEIGIYFLVAGLIGAIIDRGNREKLLTHFVRGRIYQIIEYEPGVHLSELQRKAGVARGVCAYHLHALEKAGLIKTAREGMYLRFYATKVKIDAEAYTLAADDRDILAAIERRPGITEAEVAMLLGRPSGQVSRSVRALAQSGYVEARREGEAVSLYPRTQRGLSGPLPGKA